MAACKSLKHICKTPLPVEGPCLLEPLSTWNQLPPVKPSHKSSFNEMFGELHFIGDFRMTSSSCLPLESKYLSSSSLLDSAPQLNIIVNENEETNMTSFSGNENKYDKEGLSFEDTRTTTVGNEDRENDSLTKKPCFMATTSYNHFRGHRKTRNASLGGFPPPISCMSRSGKPWVCFKSCRHDGRFVLKEIRVPDQEFLHAYREGGRLKLQFIHQEDEEILSEVEREDDDDDDPEEENGDEHS